MSDAAEIEARLEEVGDWRAATLARIRKVILEADPDVVEQIKWRKPSNPHGVPTYSHGGLICTAEMYKDKVKFTFPKGSSLPEPDGLRWSGAGVRKAVDILEDDAVDDDAFRALFLAAVAVNEGA